MTNPIITIGMPVYNGERYITQAIESLQQQTFCDFELIISDNYSSDLTEKICRNFEKNDVRIKYVCQKENIGALENFKFVLDNASGKYFMWACADDVWSKNWLEELLQSAENNKSIAFGRLEHIDQYGKPISHPGNGFSIQMTSPFSIIRKIKCFCTPGLYGKANRMYSIFPRKIITDELFNIFREVDYGADSIFVFKVLETEKIYENKNAIIYKRLHALNAGNVGHRLFIRRSAVFKKIAQPLISIQINEHLRRSKFVDALTIILLLPAVLLHVYILATKRLKKQ